MRAAKAAENKRKREKKEAEKNTEEGNSPKRQKTAGNASRSHHATEQDVAAVTESDGDDDTEDCTIVDGTGGVERPPTSEAEGHTGKVLPSPKGMSWEEYEKAAMDTFINATTRGLCERKVSDEYFGNDLLCMFLFLLRLNHSFSFVLS